MSLVFMVLQLLLQINLDLERNLFYIIFYQ